MSELKCTNDPRSFELRRMQARAHANVELTAQNSFTIDCAWPADVVAVESSAPPFGGRNTLLAPTVSDGDGGMPVLSHGCDDADAAQVDVAVVVHGATPNKYAATAAKPSQQP